MKSIESAKAMARGGGWRPSRAAAARGWVMTEALISVGILGMLVVGFGAVQARVATVNHVHWLRQRCVLAAQAQLDSIAATGRSIAPKECERLWPGVTCRIARARGTGDWEGLTLVTVTARARTRGRGVQVDLGRYVEEAKP